MSSLAIATASSANTWQGTVSSECSTAQLSSACALLALLVQAQGVTQSGSKTDVEMNARKLEDLKQQLADAVQKAREASEKSGFLGMLGDVFGSDVATIAGAVAAVAAVVATGGTAAPAILILVAEGLQVGAKVGAEMGLDPKLCMALSLASVAVGLCTGTSEVQAASTLAQAARDVKLGATIAQGAATSIGGAINYAASDYHATSLRRQSDAVRVQANQDATNLDFDDALSMLQRALRTAQRETSTASEIVQDNTDTNTALSDRI